MEEIKEKQQPQQEKQKEKLASKQKGSLIASSIVCAVAVGIEIFAAVAFGCAFKENSDTSEALGTLISLIVLFPLWIMFGCTTSAFSVIFNLCMIKPLGKLWKVALIFAIASFVAVAVVAIEVILLGTGNDSPDTSALIALLNLI